jgi:hypothetical protein
MTMSDDDANRQANLRALQRMLAYAMVESRREGVSEVVELLAAAQLSLARTLSAGSAGAMTRSEPSGPAGIRLVAFSDGRYKEGNGSKI